MPISSRPALIAASFVARPSRFIVDASLADGRRISAHLADPGRLEELLLPGARLRLRPAVPKNDRKTRFTVQLVRTSGTRGVWVSLDTMRANRLAEQLLRDGRVRGIRRGSRIEREDHILLKTKQKQIFQLYIF